MPDIVRSFDDKKFMWDGKACETRLEAEEVQRGYQKAGFETRLVDEEGKCLVYSRRVAAQQTATEGSSTP
jgi:hypothetical protein